MSKPAEPVLHPDDLCDCDHVPEESDSEESPCLECLYGDCHLCLYGCSRSRVNTHTTGD